MTFKLLLATVGTVVLLGGSVAYAQMNTPPVKTEKTDKSAKPAPAQKPRTAKSVECSKQADAKGLHGKARRKFRSECKNG
jgi:hypothetical protein